jgi:hypothetical protein
MLQVAVEEVELAEQVVVLAVLVLVELVAGVWEQCSQPQLRIRIRFATATV